MNQNEMAAKVAALLREDDDIESAEENVEEGHVFVETTEGDLFDLAVEEV